MRCHATLSPDSRRLRICSVLLDEDSGLVTLSDVMELLFEIEDA